MNQNILQNRTLLLMYYQPSNTLDENKKFILEQKKDPPPFAERKPYKTELNKFREEHKGQYNDLKHTMNTLLSIGTAFIPIVGPFISAGIGLADAYMYYNEGDTKTAGMVGMFAMIPLVGSAAKLIGPAVTKLGQKGMAELGKKVATSQPLNEVEKEIVENIGKNVDTLKQELDALVKNTAGKSSNVVTNPTTKQALFNITKKGLTFTGKNVVPYVAAGQLYSKTYDYINPQLDISQTIDVDIKKVSDANKRAALDISF